MSNRPTQRKHVAPKAGTGREPQQSGTDAASLSKNKLAVLVQWRLEIHSRVAKSGRRPEVCGTDRDRRFESFHQQFLQLNYSHIKGAVMPQQIGPNQRKWIDELRSGKFKQGQQWLRQGDRHCCLGVACEVLEVKRDCYAQDPEADDATYYYDGYNDVAPRELVSLLALRDKNASIRDLKIGNCQTLTGANDSGSSFETIADFCEQHPEAVFTEPR